MIKKYWLPAILVIILFLGSVFATVKYLTKSKTLPAEPFVSIPTLAILPTPTVVSEPGVYSILLLGQGDPSHEGSELTDSIMVVNLDTTKKTAKLIFIPRDLWVAVPGTTNKIKINEAYSQGGLGVAKQTVGALLNLPISYAILIDFNHFIQLVDVLGGIDVNITKTFDDYFYPVAGKELEDCGKSPETLAAINATMSGFLLEQQYTCRYEHLHFDAGIAHLDGATALKFARSRHSNQDGSDFGRGMRQQAILISIKNKLVTLDALKNIEKLYEKISGMVKTDLSLATVTPASSFVLNSKEYQIKQIVLSEDNVLKSSKNSRGQYILIPKAGIDDFSEIQKLVNDLSL